MLIRKYAHVIATASVLALLAGCATQKTPETAATTTTPPAVTEAPTMAPASSAEASPADAGASLSARPVPGPTLTESQTADQTLTSAANAVANKLKVNVFYFGFDQDTLDQADTDALKAHALYLNQHKNAQAILGGHADERGTREYNLALGERRAKAIAAFLRANGAASSQLEVVSYGEEKPIAEGSTEEAWAKNRRVEVSYTAGQP